MPELSEWPKALVFGESRDHTILIVFPAEVLREMLSGGVLRGFPTLQSRGTMYWAKNKLLSIQHRFPLAHLARLQRVTAPYVTIQWQREASDMDSPQTVRPTHKKQDYPEGEVP